MDTQTLNPDQQDKKTTAHKDNAKWYTLQTFTMPWPAMFKTWHHLGNTMQPVISLSIPQIYHSQVNDKVSSPTRTPLGLR